MTALAAAPEAPVIEVDHLAKIFRSRFRRRSVQAVRDVSLSVGRGTVMAFVGPNGAGKTTTIYALLGLLRPSVGSVRIFGAPAGDVTVRRRLGFQSEIFYTYGFKTATQVLRFYGRLSQMSDERLAAAVPRQLERLGLSAAADRKVNGFSKGMVQRLGLAQALLHEPELLILDEPTTGLDPEGRKLVADIILEEKARGTTVFLSSHILADVERTCDHVVILNQGRIALSDSMASLRSASDEWEIEVLAWTPAARDALAGVETADGAATGSIVRCRAADKRDVLLRLLHADAEVGAVRRVRSLEDLYMRYAGGSSSG
ncbi:MAG TPA: ABC transporter ATP-binding protein [Gemmatimonadaceae bacterium]|nr:ABC transporter ATP-binding protein [Gemmatimonadaceae bacterium]